MKRKSQALISIIAVSLLALSSLPFNAVKAEPAKDSVATTSAKPGDYHQALMVDGKQRTYYLHVPTSYLPEKAIPLVLNFHGHGSNGNQQSRLSKMNVLADQNSFIVVYPDGLENHWNDGRAIKAAKFDDIGFVRQLIKSLSDQFNIDQKRIYATGMSNGAFMCERLALEMPETFAACAMVCATMTKDNLLHQAGHPLPVLYILGTKDPIVPYQGGFIRGRPGSIIASAAETINFWVNYNNCNPKPVETIVSSKSSAGECQVTKEEYSPASGHNNVVFYQVSGGGHTWPGGLQYAPVFLIGVACQTINASDEIWKFFSAHAKE